MANPIPSATAWRVTKKRSKRRCRGDLISRTPATSSHGSQSLDVTRSTVGRANSGPTAATGVASERLPAIAAFLVDKKTRARLTTGR